MTQTLTREQVLAMEPGNKLNAWVAWKVMGYSPTDTSFNPHKGELYIRKLARNAGSRNFPNGVAIVEFAYMEMLPEFSENITAAWEVQEQVNQLSKEQIPLLKARYVAELSVIVGSNELFEIVHATPEQRCKAALLAVLDL
jgi:hypothetical protein